MKKINTRALISILAILALGFILILMLKESNRDKIQGQELAVDTVINNDIDIKKTLDQGSYYFDKTSADAYDLKKAEDSFKKVLALNEKNDYALYQISRILYLTTRFDEAENYINKYKKLYPNKKRIYYVSGLNNAYKGDLEAAIEDFKIFNSSEIASEYGYLDLAWVHFKKSEFEQAKVLLEKGMEKFDNKEMEAWFNLSLAMVEYNLGSTEKPEKLLKLAQKQALDITPESWLKVYPSNDPKTFAKEIDLFKEIIETNLLIVSGKENEINFKVDKYGIETLSGKGISGGLAVSACGSSYVPPTYTPVYIPPTPTCSYNVGSSCSSSANICGEAGLGVVACNGSCSATTPTSPNWAGPTAAQVCAGSVASQERCGDIRNEAGTKLCAVDETCPATAWSGPAASTICSGVEFIQSRCGESRVAVGTRLCPAPVQKLNLECSVDKLNWNDCSRVIKLTHKDVPFYIRNYLTSGLNPNKTFCSSGIDLHGNISLANPNLRFTKINNEFSQVNIVGNNIPSTLFEKNVFGACQRNVVSKNLKIKIINIDIIEI